MTPPPQVNPLGNMWGESGEFCPPGFNVQITVNKSVQRESQVLSIPSTSRSQSIPKEYTIHPVGGRLGVSKLGTLDSGFRQEPYTTPKRNSCPFKVITMTFKPRGLPIILVARDVVQVR